ncbi:WD repeat-containing protein 31-like isoform X1 [Styela clava]
MGKRLSKNRRRDRPSTQKNKRIIESYGYRQEDSELVPHSTVHQQNTSVTCIDVWDGNLCVSGTCNGTVSLQDFSENIVTQTWRHEKEITKVRIHDTRILSASRDKTIKIWKSGIAVEQAGQLLGHTLAVTALDCNEEFSQAYSGSRDNSVRLWDLATGVCTEENKVSRNLVTDICISSEHNLVFQTSEDRAIKLWDSRDLQMVYSFPTQSQIQTSCDISGNLGITSNNGFDGRGCEICVWDLRERKLVWTLRGHTESVTDCKFLSDNCHFVSCSHDGTVKLWDLQEHTNGSMQMISTLPVNCGNLLCIAPLGKSNILCGSCDNGMLTISIENDKLCFG